MSAYTDIPKPTDATYIPVNPDGKQYYDDVSVFYDDPNVFYDGVNNFAWTDIPKPTNQQVQLLAGMTIGLLMPLTNAVTQTIGSDGWVRINKPTS